MSILDKNLISASELVSQEQITDLNGNAIPLFSGVGFNISEGESFGISATNPRAVDVLCRIIGNATPYFSGKCRVGRIGTMQKKKKLLPHIFNIDSPDMLIDEVTVLEHLMLVTLGNDQYPKDWAEREAALLDLLVQTGLGYISLNRISGLSKTERLLVEFFIASLSNSSIIIFNIVNYTFSQREVELIVNIVNSIRKDGKCAVIGTMQPKIIGMACDGTVYIHQGRQLFSGTVEELCKNADKVGFVLKIKDAEATAAKITEHFSGWECDVDGDTIYIFNYSGTPVNTSEFYKFLAEQDIQPDNIKSNRGRVENSYTELLRNNVLHG